MWCQPCPPPQRLPVSTGNVGIDPMGQVQVYAAPRVVHAKCTLWREWPAAPAWWWGGGRGWVAGCPPRPWPNQGCGCGGHCSCGSFSNALAVVLTGGCPS